MKTLKNKKPTLIIYPNVKLKMDWLISMSSEELAWHGFIERVDDYTFQWYDIIMYPQYNTSVTSTSEDDEYTEWLIKQMSFDNFEDMRLHGHSHVNMSCTPSGTDNAFRNDIIANLKDDDYYFFIIANKKGDYTLELYDMKTKILYETQDIEVITSTRKALEETKEWATTAIKNNVKVRRNKVCSTTSRAKSSSTQKSYGSRCTYSDVEPWEDPYLKYLQD